MNQSKAWIIPLECLFYLAAAVCFFVLRAPYLPLWWADFNSDYALVGTMAQRTLEGHFPIFYFGQNYMGGLEWATAALGAKLTGAREISLEILRWNELLWWFAAGAAWVLFLRRLSALLAVVFAGFFAFGNYVLLGASVNQDLTPTYLFFGALLTWVLWARKPLTGNRGFWFGALLGFSWWTNQSVIFFLLPALVVCYAEPGAWWRHPLAQEFVRPVRALRFVYALVGVLFLVGVVVALAGGLNVSLGQAHLKIPNGLSLAKTVLLVGIVFQLIAKLRARPEFRREVLRLGFLARPLLTGFLVGYAPVWLGRIFRLYDKAYGVGLAILPVSEWAGQGRALARAMDTLLFSSILGENLGSFAAPATFLILGALAAFAWRERALSPVRFALGVFALNLVYVFFSSRAQGAPTRYLYPAMVGAWLIVLVPAALSRYRRARFPITLALLVLAAFGTARARASLDEHFAAHEWRRENYESVLREVGAGGFRYCWGDYWTSYLLTFLSGEKIIFAPHPGAPDNQVRVPETQRLVQGAAPACYVYRAPGRGEFRFLATNPWEKR